MFKDFLYLLIAAGSANASPVGPDAPPTNPESYVSDPVKGWHDFTWTNGDASAYTQVTVDAGSSVERTYSPGVTDSATGGSLYLETADLDGATVGIRHTKNGILNPTSGWVWVELGA